MAKIGAEFKKALILTSLLFSACVFFAAAEEGSDHVGEKIKSGYFTRIISFAAKSGYAFLTSGGMITGAALASVYYNLKLRHPKLDLPIIDYNLPLLFQPMLGLGSVSVSFSMLFSRNGWLQFTDSSVLFVGNVYLLDCESAGTSTKAFFKGVETWKKETVLKKELAARLLASDCAFQTSTMSLWKEVGIIFAVWTFILVLHISKDFTAICSAT